MPVNNAHLSKNVQVWDGLKFEVIPVTKARELEKMGMVQITQYLQAKDLKTVDQFKAHRAELEAAKPKTKRKRKSYKTREMTAE